MKKKILIIGDIFLDIFSYGSVERISPESHAPVFNLVNKNYMLGGAANVASNLKSLGADVTLIGKIGNDYYGRKIKKILKINNIKFVNLSSEKTIYKNRYVTDFGQIIRVDREEIIENNISDYIKIEKIIKKNNYHGLYISDYQKGLIDLNLNRLIIRNKKFPIFCDPKNRNLKIFRGFDFIKPNLKYIKNFFNFDYSNKKNIKSIKNLLKKNNILNCIITLGNKGSILINKNQYIYSKSDKVPFYDLSGAGDTFGSIFFLKFIEGNKFEDILKISNYGASKVITKKGTSVITNSDLYNTTKKKIYFFGKDNKLILDTIRVKDKIIGFTNGCFDILHAGHIQMLNFSKKNCDFLICGINSDESIKKIKGKNRPILDEVTRAETLNQFKIIDMVIIFNETNPLKLIKLIKPNLIIKGSDYKINKVIGADFVKSYGGKVLLADLKKGFSTTKIINKYCDKSENN